MNAIGSNNRFRALHRPMPASLAVFGLLLASAASAETNTGVMVVTANIDAACTVSASPLAFGTVVPGTVKDTDAVVSATCTSGTAYVLDLGNGANSTTTGGTSGDQFRRQMAAGANLLPYALYQETTRVTAIDATATGGGASNNFLTTTVGDGTAQTKTVFGRVVAAESTGMVPGSYSDSVVVTITF